MVCIYFVIFLTFSTLSKQHKSLVAMPATDFCMLSSECTHDGRRVCGITPDGTRKRNFLDLCDMYEFNCDNGMRYYPIYFIDGCNRDCKEVKTTRISTEEPLTESTLESSTTSTSPTTSKNTHELSYTEQVTTTEKHSSTTKGTKISTPVKTTTYKTSTQTKEQTVSKINITLPDTIATRTEFNTTIANITIKPDLPTKNTSENNVSFITTTEPIESIITVSNETIETDSTTIIETDPTTTTIEFTSNTLKPSIEITDPICCDRPLHWETTESETPNYIISTSDLPTTSETITQKTTSTPEEISTEESIITETTKPTTVETNTQSEDVTQFKTTELSTTQTIVTEPIITNYVSESPGSTKNYTSIVTDYPTSTTTESTITKCCNRPVEWETTTEKHNTNEVTFPLIISSKPHTRTRTISAYTSTTMWYPTYCNDERCQRPKTWYTTKFTKIKAKKPFRGFGRRFKF